MATRCATLLCKTVDTARNLINFVIRQFRTFPSSHSFLFGMHIIYSKYEYFDIFKALSVRYALLIHGESQKTRPILF